MRGSTWLCHVVELVEFDAIRVRQLVAGSTGSVQLAYSSAYEAQALQQSATGTWSFVGRSGVYSLVPGSVLIDASGIFTLNQITCTTTGNITPRPSGKNVFNINLTATGAGCAVGQSNLSGVAYLDTSVTPSTVIAISLTPARDDGLIVLLTKQQRGVFTRWRSIPSGLNEKFS